MLLNSNSKLDTSLTQYKSNTESALKLIDKTEKEDIRKDNLSTALMSKIDMKSQYSDFIDHYKKSTINLNRKFSSGNQGAFVALDSSKRSQATIPNLIDNAGFDTIYI